MVDDIKNPYRSSVERVLFDLDSIDWREKYHRAADERDHLLTRVLELEQRLLAATEDDVDKFCPVRECGLPSTDTSRIGLCIVHAGAARMEAIELWSWDALRERLWGKDRTSPRIHASEVPRAVYYIDMGGQIKIGMTTNLRQRMHGLRVTPDKLLAVEPGGRERELQRHAEFAHLRTPNTELFHKSDDLERHIKLVAATFGPPDQFI